MRSAFAALCLAFAALHLFTFLNPQCDACTMTAADEVPLLHSAAQVLPPLAAVVILFIAVALIYQHLMGRQVGAVPVAAGAGNGRRSISGFVMFVLCVSAGTLEFIVFGHGQAAGGGAEDEDHSAQARVLGLAALRALPAVATGAFFGGLMLIIVGVAHVRAGREVGGTGAVAGDGPIQGLPRHLTKVAGGMAAALVALMVIALTLHIHGAKY